MGGRASEYVVEEIMKSSIMKLMQFGNFKVTLWNVGGARGVGWYEGLGGLGGVWWKGCEGRWGVREERRGTWFMMERERWREE